jgi:hypothetical protein
MRLTWKMLRNSDTTIIPHSELVHGRNATFGQTATWIAIFGPNSRLPLWVSRIKWQKLQKTWLNQCKAVINVIKVSMVPSELLKNKYFKNGD